MLSLKNVGTSKVKLKKSKRIIDIKEFLAQSNYCTTQT